MQTTFIFLRLVFTKALLLAVFALPATAENTPQEAINALLDDFHQAAADADRERYLGYFAADGVFMGTDDWERWPLPAFRDYVAQRFEGGTGWTYTPEERFVTMGPGGRAPGLTKLSYPGAGAASGVPGCYLRLVIIGRSLTTPSPRWYPTSVLRR
jgi:hypothetical protein